MALIHHLELGVERNVGERAVPIWTKQPRPGWLPGPLPGRYAIEVTTIEDPEPMYVTAPVVEDDMQAVFDEISQAAEAAAAQPD